MKLAAIFLTAATVLASAAYAAGPTVIAHRGLWQAPGSAQNSIRSLLLADSIGSDASEFDVWRTKDGLIIVNHDKTINGVDIESCTSDVVLAQKLENGENVPTLEEYLAAAKPLKTRLILEIKAHNHNSNERAAIKETVALVKNTVSRTGQSMSPSPRTAYSFCATSSVPRFPSTIPEETIFPHSSKAWAI